MATEPVTGVDVIVKISDTEVLGQRNASLSYPTEMVDTTCKADYPNKRQQPGWLGPWSVKCDGLLYAGGTGGIADIIAKVQAKTLYEVEVTVGDSGEKLVGNAYIVNPELNGPQTGEGTMSCELAGDGVLTPTQGT